VFLSHQQAFGTTPTACIRFAVLSRIEILHILLEHSYDSQRKGSRPVRDDWAQFLLVHALGDACTAMAHQVCDLLDGHPRA
jgi:hypothetical protein